MQSAINGKKIGTTNLAEQERPRCFKRRDPSKQPALASNLSKVSEIAGRRPADWF